MKIIVEQSDIDTGIPRSATDCPIAKAVMRVSVGTYEFVRVGFISIRCMDRTNVTRTYTIPLKVSEFIGNFDAGRSVEPFEFDIELSG